MINFEWGIEGIQKYSDESDVTVIVDIFSFSTCVDAALSRGAVILPYEYNEGAANYSKKQDAILALRTRSLERYSLSPVSLLNLSADERLVLPSPNGSALSLSAKTETVLCACLRNFKAVAGYASSLSENILVIAAGEKWPDGKTRFAVEDIFGAGAVISELSGELSAESKAAALFFSSVKDDMLAVIGKSISAEELTGRGFSADVDYSLELNVSNIILILKDKAYVNALDLNPDPDFMNSSV